MPGNDAVRKEGNTQSRNFIFFIGKLMTHNSVLKLPAIISHNLTSCKYMSLYHVEKCPFIKPFLQIG